MTYAAPNADYYDDGLVHSHHWSRSTPPGEHQADSRATGTHDRHETQKDHTRG